MSRTIFVFGSNEAGRHGAGSALEAVKNHGALYGEGHGLRGNSYAIPTKDGRLRTLPLAVIRAYVGQFLQFARSEPTWAFQIVAIGCGLAGYTPDEIAPMFATAPDNCELPAVFRAVLEKKRADLAWATNLPRSSIDRMIELED